MPILRQPFGLEIFPGLLHRAIGRARGAADFLEPNFYEDRGGGEEEVEHSGSACAGGAEEEEA
ncbi:MAG: hypothetical protein Q9217_006324 [Psora testacea]